MNSVALVLIVTALIATLFALRNVAATSSSAIVATTVTTSSNNVGFTNATVTGVGLFGNDDKVHIAMSGDRQQWQAMLTAINSIVANSATPQRLQFHLFCVARSIDSDECAALRHYVASLDSSTPTRNLLFVPFDGHALVERFARSSVSSRSEKQSRVDREIREKRRDRESKSNKAALCAI